MHASRPGACMPPLSTCRPFRNVRRCQLPIRVPFVQYNSQVRGVNQDAKEP